MSPSTASTTDQGAFDCVLLRPSAVLPSRAHHSDVGLDLYAAVDARLAAAGGRAPVPTGLAVAIPPDCAGLVCPRSGLALDSGVTVLNAPGVIDPGFRGEVTVILVNLDPEHDYAVTAGDRVAQLLLVRANFASPRLVDELPTSDRQATGLGSTGR